MIHVSNADKLVIYGYVEGMWVFFSWDRGKGVKEPSRVGVNELRNVCIHENLSKYLHFLATVFVCDNITNQF